MFINPRGSRYIAFYSTDRELIYKISRLLRSRNKISVRKRSNPSWKESFCLQIGSKEIYNTLLKLGLKPAKANRLSLPEIPRKYFRHFVRGYFDGDGCVSHGYYKRKDRKKDKYILMVRFASGSKDFLRSLSNRLSVTSGVIGGCITKNTGGQHLVYSKNDSGKLFNFMYNGVSNKEYLERKYNKFQKAFRTIGVVA